MKTNSLLCIRHFVIAVFAIGATALFSNMAFGQVTIRGNVFSKSDNSALSGANVTLGDSYYAITAPDGSFQFSKIREGSYELEVSFVGFSAFRKKLAVNRDTTIQIAMEVSAVLGDEVNIVATRAQDKYPTAYQSITRRDIQALNLGKDIPYLIQQTPSVVVGSDGGNGIGYTSISIRGSDLTRINVTVNSIPLNDAESQGVWFVDLPDVASSTSSIQIQRGVGTSTNGAGAFGASINFMTSDFHQDPYGELDMSGGSFGTFKSTLRFGTGLTNSKFSVDGRVSFIKSDGYVDRASSNLKSYYFSGGYYGKKTTLKFITFSGLERTYQAWNGAPKDSLATNRTYNPSGEYIDQTGHIAYYKDQVDNYQQDHYQFIFSQVLSSRWNLNSALHFTKGKGYYENYEQNQALADYGLNDVILGNDTISATNLVNRKIMDNDFYGITFSANYTLPDKLKISLGGAWNQYNGRHFGKIIWAECASNGDNDRNWYYNTGLKRDFNIFGKASYQVTKKISLFADLQYRHVSYKMSGILDDLRTIDQDHQFNFFNPKAGLYYSLNKANEFFFSFGVANREPSRNNYKDADPGKIPTNETLYDYEAGYSLRIPRLTLAANLYIMNYRDQLVLTGEINNVGEAVMVNVPRSFRRGIEVSAITELVPEKLVWNLTATLSQNKIRDFVQYIDTYSADWTYLGQQSTSLGKTDLSFSPSAIASSMLTYKPVHSLSISLNSKYVGKQYIDNTSSPDRMLKGYFVNGINIGWSVKPKLFEEIGFTLALNNIFSAKYETNAWVYPYLIGGQYAEYNGYFPQALVNFLVGIRVRI